MIDRQSSSAMQLPLARRVAGIEPFQVMALLARAKVLESEGRDIVHMEIGEPDFPTPQPVIDAGRRALETGELFYTAATGLPKLREAIADFYQVRYGVAVPPSRIVVTTGSSSALLLVMAALVSPGDQVLMTDPGYPANRHFVRLMEGEAVAVPVGAETGYQLTPELVERHWTDRTVAVLMASPSNPAGALVSSQDLRSIAAFVRQKGGMLIVDEIYHGLVYDASTDVSGTALAAGDNVFVINSFSKYFNMTGWRLGWMVAPREYIEHLDKLSQNIYLSAPSLAQTAALAAFAPETLAICDARRDVFRERRDYLVPALRELGFGIPHVPSGAFYVYAGCGRLTSDSQTFAVELLEQAGVAVAPGADFGQYRAREHLRFAYTRPVARLREGMQRIRQYLNR